LRPPCGRNRRRSGPAFASTQAQPLRTLTTLRQAHSLSADEARRSYPIHVQAVVTYFDRYLDKRRIAFFLCDRTGCIYAAVPRDTVWPGRAPLPGTLVDVSGISAPGDFAPIINQARITILGTPGFPARPRRSPSRTCCPAPRTGNGFRLKASSTR